MKLRLRDGTGTIDLKHLVEDVDRHGNVRVYVRRHGRKVRIRETPGTEEFLAAYRTALGGVATQPQTRTAPTHGSLRWLCIQYYRSADYRGLGESTRRVRRGILDGLCAAHGQKPNRLMEARHVRSLRDEKADLRCSSRTLRGRRQAMKALVIMSPAETPGFDTITGRQEPAVGVRRPSNSGSKTFGPKPKIWPNADDRKVRKVTDRLLIGNRRRAIFFYDRMS